MGLYERLLAEAVQDEKDKMENPEQDEQRRRLAQKRQRRKAYIHSRRRAVVNEGGYVASEEVQRDQEGHLADLQALRGLIGGA